MIKFSKSNTIDMSRKINKMDFLKRKLEKLKVEKKVKVERNVLN